MYMYYLKSDPQYISPIHPTYWLHNDDDDDDDDDDNRIAATPYSLGQSLSQEYEYKYLA